ncbi:MAG: NAD(P)/FAD-dependent oxidoreductase [Treponema sp.]|nr:NAD(P)/FAD-dependent oxidoreductase [Treponema sp.]
MKKIIVVGAGIAGLSAAIYARRNGFDVTLIEQHSIAGGMCTSWKRKGYLFEGAVHWLTGSSPKTELYQLWKDTGALGDNVKVLLNDVFYSVEHDGIIINLYRDLDKTVKHLSEISPNDKKRLLRLASDVKTLSCMEMPVYDIKGVKTQNPKRMNLSSLFKMLPALIKFGKLNKISSGEYADQFEHPGIRRLFRVLSDEYSAGSFIVTLASLNMGDGGYPEGGSLAMTDRMVKTFKDLGGSILFNTKVNKVNIENGSVTGIRLDGKTLDADAVIVTQETIAAVNQLFGIPLKEYWLADICKNTKPAVCTFISVGISADILPSPVPVWILDEPIIHAGKKVTEIGFYNYAKYKGYAPEGCTALTTAFMCDTYDFWKKAKEEGRYEEEKQNLAKQISRAVCKKFPQAEGKIEVIDIATPLTYERYTGAYHGSWMSVTGAGDKMKSYPGFLKNIKGLYFAGHRLMSPGGLPVAVFTGRQAAQMVCRQFDCFFR